MVETDRHVAVRRDVAPGPRFELQAWRGSVSYIHSNTRHLQRRLNRNLFAPTHDATGMPIYPTTRPDSTIGILSVNESTAKARYDGFQVGIAGHHKPVDVGVNYTLALNKDDDSNDGPEWTYSKQDVRHHFTWSVVTDLGAGFVFSGVLITRSGLGPDTADGPPVSDTGANQFAKPDQT